MHHATSKMLSQVMMKKLIDYALSLILMIAIGSVVYHFVLKPFQASRLTGDENTESHHTQAFFASQLLDVDAKPYLLAQYKGKTLIVNFWATWCAPCREEMPDLSDLNKILFNQKVSVIGLAVDEQEAVKQFQVETPVSYPLLIAETEGMVLSTQLGNAKGVLPFTVIVDKEGNVAKTYYGKITKAMLLQALKSMHAIK